MADGSCPQFSALLRQARRDAGLTQEELAERAGISERAISDLERGVNRAPRKDTLELLADALNLPAAQRQEWEQARHQLRRPGEPRYRTAHAIHPRPSSNVPAPATTFIGRTRELGEVLALLRQPEGRLTTLTGPGGVGKTRLALAVADEVLADFPDGIWFVDLSAVTDAALVVPTIAQVLGVQAVLGQVPLDTLTRSLHDKHLLLVLDNLEQVVGGVNDIGSIRSRCRHVHILGTSRVPLRLSGEHEYLVDPLGLPDPAQVRTADVALEHAAIRLFIERGRSVRPDFTITDDMAPVVAEICTRLDGLPLAIELAAALTRLFSARGLLRRLEHRLPVLVGGPRDAPARQQTLHKTIAWSYELLEPQDQVLLRRLAVFRGGWSLEAAEAVAGDDMRIEVLLGLERLVEHNLIRVLEGLRSEPRFVMLETIREFALEQLEAIGERSAAQRRHAEHFCVLAEHADPELRGLGRFGPDPQLLIEEDNLREALHWTLRGDGDRIVGLRIASSLYWFLWAKGGESSIREAHDWLERALSLTPVTVDPVQRAKAVCGLGYISWTLGDNERAKALLAESREVFHRADESWHEAFAVHQLAHTFDDDGEHDIAVPLFREGLELFQRLDDQWGILFSLNCLGTSLEFHGAYDEARPILEDSLARARDLGKETWEANALCRLGDVMRAQGEQADSARCYAESLKIFHRTGLNFGIAVQLVSLARTALDRGEPIVAARLLGAARTAMDLFWHTRGSRMFWAAYDETMLGARALLDDEAFTSLFEDGIAMPQDDAVAYALANAPTP